MAYRQLRSLHSELKKLILNLICSLFLLIVIHMQKAQKKKPEVIKF